MIKFKTIKVLKPSKKVLKTINSTKPISLSVTNGEIKVLEPTNIQTIIPIWIINIIGIILLIGITHISYNKVMKIIPKKK